MARTFLPTADAALLLFAQNFSALLTANFAAYSITQSVAGVYSSKFNTYKTALGVATADPTRGKSTVFAKDTAKKDLIAYTRQVAGQINRTMSVTNQQRSDLGLIIRKPPTPVPAPTSRPATQLMYAIMRNVKVRVWDDSTEYKRSKAPSTIGAKMYTFVGDEYPSDPTRWAYQGDATRGTFEMTFSDSIPNGAQVWICAAWFNRKGETGPISVPISTNVQGGGASVVESGMKLAA